MGSDSNGADGEVQGGPSSASASFEPWLKAAAELSPAPRGAVTRLRTGEELCAGRFRIERVLGEGGMGVVYEALDREGSLGVALKTLHQLDAGGIYRLKNEFRSLADVVHPSLVRLHELFVDASRWFFSMELVPGLPFDEWVRPEGVLDETRLRSALRQLVAGTRAIHAAGKLHCDLKPSNVLVTAAGRLVILDLGLVADPAGGVGRTLDDRAMGGTPAYMAPEQVTDGGLCPASDWYAVGVMLFEALTGRLPFDGSPGSILARKQLEDAPVPSALAEGVPSDLEEMCRALLSREPGKRPSAEQIVSIVGAPPNEQDTSAPRLHETAELVGREAEMQELRDAYALAKAGRPTVVRLVGESGAGKSALASRFLEELAISDRAVVLHGRCYEAESVPYKAFDRLIDQLTRYLRRLPPVEAAALLPRDVAALARLFPVLDRVEAVAQAPAREVRDERQARDRAFGALAELLARMRDRRPVILHIDDMQWTDIDSMLLLGRLLGDPDGAPVLYLLSHRALADTTEAEFERLERTVRANRQAAMQRMVLGPLSRAAATLLAQGLLRDVQAPDGLAQSVADEAQGSPFFIAELVRFLRQAGTGARPPRISVRDALNARLARLDARSRDLLDLVALSGRPVPVDVIERALGTSSASRADFAALRAEQLVRPSSERAYECFHDRIRVALVEQLDARASRELHARLARAWSEREDADPEVLFEHCRSADMREEAATHALRAAERSNQNLAFERCAEFYAEAIALLPEREIERLGLRERRAEALSMAGRWAAAGSAFADAADRTTGRRRTTYLTYQAAVHYLATGRRAEGLPRLRSALAQTGVRWPRTRIGAWLSVLWHLLRLWASGARFRFTDVSLPAQFGRTSEHVFPDGDDPPDDRIRVEMFLAGAALVPPYDLTRGVYFMTAFARRALLLGDRERVPVALGMLSVLLSASRLTAGLARRLGEQAVALARAVPPSALQSAAFSFAGFRRFRVAELEEALVLGSEAERALHGLHRTYAYEAWTARTVQGFALTLMGRVGDAASLFAAIGREARELGDELAALAGELSIRYLVSDDVEGAADLVAHKRGLLAQVGQDGAVHQIVLMDRITCALYEGRGREALPLFRETNPAAQMTVDAPALPALCALQAIAQDAPTPALRHIVERAIRRLDRERLVAAEALAAQLRAALCMMDRDEEGARAQIGIATDAYARAGMKLHEAILRWHHGRIVGGSTGNANSEEAEGLIRALGVANPARWAHMLAPGLTARDEPQVNRVRAGA